MEYDRQIQLENGQTLTLRHGTAEDGAAALDNFLLAHGETDFLLTYPDENTFTPEQEADYLSRKAADPRQAEILAVLDGQIVGTAGIDAVGSQVKVRHRAEFGINVAKAYWGLGIGRALTEACIALAREAGYAQLELDAVADNARALALYEKLGFREYGRNEKGFLARSGQYQTLILMLLEL